jgi:hypothetical protein
LAAGAAGVLVAGLGSVAAVSAQAAPHAPTATRPAAASNIEHVLFASTNPNGSPHVALSGPIHDAGVDHQISQNADKLVLGAGTITINHPGGKYHSKFYKGTCTSFGQIQGKYTLTGGSGSYANVTGHGTYTAVFAARAKRVNGSCDKRAKPIGFTETITANGPISTS